MLPTNKNITSSELILIRLYDFVESSIESFLYSGFDEEKVNGETDAFVKVQDKLLIIGYGVLIWLSHIDGLDYLTLDSIYNFTELKKALACRNLLFKDFIKSLNIETSTITSGISIETIDTTLIVNDLPFTGDSNIMDIEKLLKLDECCNITLGVELDVLATQIQDEPLVTQNNELILL